MSDPRDDTDTADQVEEPDIRAEDEHVYAVTLTAEDGTTSEHRVEIPTALLDDWGKTLTDEPPLVRAAIELLDTHHSSLPARFALTDSAVAYDGFLEELRLALGD